MRLAVVDDHQLFRKGMKSLLEKMDHVEVVTEASNGREFLDQLENQSVDLVFLDLKMPVLDGHHTLLALQKTHPQIKVLFLTMETGNETILRCMEDGAHGFLAKDAHPDEVRKAIKDIQDNGIYMNASTTKVMMKGLSEWKSGSREPHVALNDREQLILKGICQQKTTSEIADDLYLSPRTVEGYRRTLLEKTNSKSSVGLVLFAAKMDWLNQWMHE